MADLPPGIFRSWRSYWDFARSVSRELRFVRTPETEDFLAAVLETSASRRITIPAGELYWRAQLGHGWRPMGSDSDDLIPCAYPRERMKPLAGRASDGRANPRGIPCLYVSTTKETAMSEVRPWVGSYVSVGQFEILRDLTIVDCARGHTGTPFFFEEPSPEVRMNTIWTHIDHAFAEPMTRSDDQADYAPTQILAELFKSAGINGVVYKSNFGDEGFNIALFDPECAELINCGLYEVKRMEPSFVEADAFYFVKRPS
jgi:hypothetical protein